MSNSDKYRTNAFGVSEKQNSAVEEESEIRDRHRQNAYEKFFAGYDTYLVPRDNGPGWKIIREYTGTIYHEEMSHNQSMRHRMYCGTLFAAATILFIMALYLDTESNRCWVMIFSFIALIMYARLLLSLFTYISSTQELKVYDYQYGAMQLQPRCRQAVYSVFILIVVSLVWFFIYSRDFNSHELFRIILLIASAAILYGIYLLNKNVGYKEICSSEDDKNFVR